MTHCTHPFVVENTELSAGAQKFDLKSVHTEGMREENNSVLDTAARAASYNASLP